MRKPVWVCALLFIATISRATDPPIEVVSIEFPPFVTSTQSDYGYSFRLLSKFAQAHYGREIVPLFLPPARAQQYLDTHPWCLSFYPPKGERTLIALEDREVAFGLYRLRQDAPFAWQELTQFANQSVAVLRAAQYGQVAQQYVDAGLVMVPVDSLQQGLDMLLRGRVDYWDATDFAFRTDEFPEDLRDKLQFSDPPVMTFPVGFFFNPECQATLKRMPLSSSTPSQKGGR